jgi:hypothetical protein
MKRKAEFSPDKIQCPMEQKDLKSGDILEVLVDREGKCNVSKKCKVLCVHKKTK